MPRARTTRGPTIALLALAAVLFSVVSLGLHSGANVVGQATLEPTTVYFSGHSSEEDEEHLHAETGFESVFCLACFLSLRDQTIPGASHRPSGLADIQEATLPVLSSSPVDPPGRLSSPRAPPAA